MSTSTLSAYISKYHGKTEIEGDTYAILGDLLTDFKPDQTHLMDVKMGKRTFKESAVKDKKRRMDLLQKMVKTKKDEATEEELEHGITKLRYQQFREKMSTSESLGFRVDAMSVPDTNGKSVSAEEAKKMATSAEVKACFLEYIAGRKDCWSVLLHKLKALRVLLEESDWFANHELIGSSLFFAFDCSNPDAQSCGVWMIDFANATPSARPLTHRAEWIFNEEEGGNQEEGYLSGLDNLIDLWEALEVH